MKLNQLTLVRYVVIGILISSVISCKKEDTDINDETEVIIETLQLNALVGYSLSISNAVFSESETPENVSFDSVYTTEFAKAGIIYAQMNEDYPLPFNSITGGNLIIAGLWEGDYGLISIFFAEINFKENIFDYSGIYVFPVYKSSENKLLTVYQDSDKDYEVDINDIFNLTKSDFEAYLLNLNQEFPIDYKVAMNTDYWFVEVNTNVTPDDIYDDVYTFNGGGQTKEVSNSSSGVKYIALINSKLNYSDCSLNPIAGNAYIQNISIGSSIDLGTLELSFKNYCMGDSFVSYATGKYEDFELTHIPFILD